MSLYYISPVYPEYLCNINIFALLATSRLCVKKSPASTVQILNVATKNWYDIIVLVENMIMEKYHGAHHFPAFVGRCI